MKYRAVMKFVANRNSLIKVYKESTSVLTVKEWVTKTEYRVTSPEDDLLVGRSNCRRKISIIWTILFRTITSLMDYLKNNNK